MKRLFSNADSLPFELPLFSGGLGRKEKPLMRKEVCFQGVYDLALQLFPGSLVCQTHLEDFGPIFLQNHMNC